MKQFIVLVKTIARQWNIVSTNRILRISTFLALSFIGISIVMLLLSFKNLPPQIPLWYSKPWGADRLTSPGFLFLLPVGSFISLAISITIISLFLTNHLVFAQILIILSSVATVLSSITLFEILALVQ